MHPRDVLAQAARDPDAVDRYAPGPDHVIDLYLPPGNEPAPVIVLAHGGYWQFDRRPCRLLAGALADDGFIVVLPEYRLTGGVGGWPQSYRDIRAAVNHLPELLAKLAQPRPVDIVLVGHSAGGHMAVCLARRADLPAGITRVVALAPAAENRRESATSTSSTHAHPRIPPSWRPSAGAVLDRARAAGRVGPVDAKPGQSLDQRAAELNRWITDLLTWRSHVMAAWDARLMTRS